MKRTAIIIGVITVALVGIVVFVARPWASSSADAGSSWQQQLGCTSVTQEQTDELYALALYTCAGPNGQTAVNTFQDNAARDQWIGIAKEVGAVVLAQGDRWVQTK